MLRKTEKVTISDLEPLRDPGQVSGFKSPADDYREDRLNIMERLISDPVNTYYFEADSDDMELFGIKRGSILVVDRSLKPTGGRLVIIEHDGRWIVRQLICLPKKKLLTTGKEDDMPLELDEEKGMQIWGVVTWSCRRQLEVKKYVRSR